MTTVAEHNELNVYESAEARFEVAAKQLGLEEGLYRFLKYPNKEITVYIPVVMDDGRIVDLHIEPKNRAHELIEDFMIAANGVTARYLASQGFPSIRRVVLAPERWDRIVAIAAQYRVKLPARAAW